jgi:hypothetical protein
MTGRTKAEELREMMDAPLNSAVRMWGETVSYRVPGGMLYVTTARAAGSNPTGADNVAVHTSQTFVPWPAGRV